MLALALFIAIAAFTAGGFVAGWMACAAFQAAEDGGDERAEGDWPFVPSVSAAFHSAEVTDA